MLETNGKCPHCGKTLISYVEWEWKYGTPIRTCRSCGKKYLDRRYHEIAVEGIAPDAMSVKHSMVCMLFGIVVSVISALATIMQIYLWRSYSMRIAALGVIGLLISIFMLTDIIRIKSGAKQRKFLRLRAESELRLRDQSYARELYDLGYDVPVDYL